MTNNPNTIDTRSSSPSEGSNPVIVSTTNNSEAWRLQMAAKKAAMENDQKAAQSDLPRVEERTRDLERQLRDVALKSAPQGSLLRRIENSNQDNRRPVAPEVAPSAGPQDPIARVLGAMGQLRHGLGRRFQKEATPRPVPPAQPEPSLQELIEARDSETGAPVIVNLPKPPPPPPPLRPLPPPQSTPESMETRQGIGETQNNPPSPVTPPVDSSLNWLPFVLNPVGDPPEETEAEYARGLAKKAQEEAVAAAEATRQAEKTAADKKRGAWVPSYIGSHADASEVPPPSLPSHAVILEPLKKPEPGAPVHGPHVYYGSRLNPDLPRKRRHPGEIGRDILEAHSQDVVTERLIKDIRQEMAAVHEFADQFRNQSGEIDQEKFQDYLRLFSDEMAHGKYTKEDERALRFLTFLSKSLVSPNNHIDYRSGTGLPCRPPIVSSDRGDIIVAYCDALANRLSPGGGVERLVWETVKREYPQNEWEAAYSKAGSQIRARLMNDHGHGLSAERSQRVIAYARQLISREFAELTLSRIDENNRIEVAAAYGLPDVAALGKLQQAVTNARDNLFDLARTTRFSRNSVLTTPAEQLAGLSGHRASDIEKWQRIVKKELARKKRLEERNTHVVFIQLDEDTQDKVNKLIAALETRKNAKRKLLGRLIYDKSDLSNRQKVLDAEKKEKIDHEKSAAAAKAKSEADKLKESHLLNVANIASTFIEKGVLISINDQDPQHVARAVAYRAEIIRMLNQAASNNLGPEQIDHILKQLGVTREQLNRLAEGMVLVPLEGDNLIFWQTLQRLGFGPGGLGNSVHIDQQGVKIKNMAFSAAERTRVNQNLETADRRKKLNEKLRKKELTPAQYKDAVRADPILRATFSGWSDQALIDDATNYLTSGAARADAMSDAKKANSKARLARFRGSNRLTRFKTNFEL